MEDAPKILLLGDYSNCHRSLALGLRRIGCNVVQISEGSNWMNCDRDVDISRSAGKLGGLKLYCRLRFGNLRKLISGYDIVAIHDPNFVKLRPARLMPIFNYIRRNNRSVFLTAMSTDIAYLDMVSPPNSPLRYSEWFVGDKPSRMNVDDPSKWRSWHNEKLVKYQQHVFDNLDGAVSVLYEYHLGMERRLGSKRVAYGGIPIDTNSFQPVEIDGAIKKVKIFLGRDRTRKLMKGSDLLEVAARRVVERYPERAELRIVENVPYSEFVELLRDSHLVLDQIYSYTPATTALMAMAYGLNVVSGAEPEYYDFIGEKENRPIINAAFDCDTLTSQIEQIVLHPQQLSERGHRSREFVVKHNDCEVVARRCFEFWNQRLNIPSNGE